ncbi:response regulator [Microvirga sp. 2YAF29]|uniref:response regulator n=1 Tax=Microvirga sp. 2YAF29 TaxID=3233031 RepID=UPI003F96311D
MRILIVEDEFLIALELESLLQDIGHDVVGIAASSAEAIDLARQSSPDLAFVDVHLSDGLTGIDAARALSEKEVTVLFMTANAKRIPEDFAGARGVIAKPYTERGVKEALAYVTAGEECEEKDPHRMTFIPFDLKDREDSSSLP